MLYNILLTSFLALSVLAQKHHHHSSVSSSFASFSSPASAAPKVSAATSILLFLGPEGDKDTAWEASIVGINDCSTTIGLTCTEGACKREGGVTATVTEGNNVYQFSTSTALKGVTQVVSEKCELIGTATAKCSVDVAATSGTSTKHTSITSDFKGAQVQFAQVPVTAGVSLLSSADKTCSAAITGASSSASSSGSSSGSPSSSSPTGLPGASNTSTSSGSSGQTSTSTSSGGVAAPTSLSSVYKILIVPAAALLALA